MNHSQMLPAPTTTEVWASRLFEVAALLFVSSLLLGGLNGPKNTGFYLGVIAFALRWRAPQSLFRDAFRSPLVLPLLAMFGAGIWGSLNSWDPGASWNSFFRRDNFGMAIAFALMAILQRPDRAQIKRLFGVVLFLFGLRCAWQLGYMVRNPVWLSPQVFPYEVLWNVRFFGELMILLCPWVWAMPAVFGNQRLRIAAGVWTVLVVAMLVPTGFRGAWLGFAASVLVWTVLSGWRWKVLPWVAAGLALVLAFLLLLPEDNLAVRALRRGADDSFRLTAVWPPTLDMMAQAPLTGYGFGMELFRQEYLQERPRHPDWVLEELSDPHSNALAVQFAGGLPASLAYVLLIGACLVVLWRRRNGVLREGGDAHSHHALLASWAATYLTLGQFDIVDWNYLGFLLVASVLIVGASGDGPVAQPGCRAGRRILFVIRDKLGDSLLAFATVQQYLKLRPGDDVTVLMRKDYAGLVAGEGGFRLVRYRGGAQALLWAALQRLFARPYDAMVVLRGFGDRVRKLGALVPARRRISFSGKLAPTFSEWPPAFETENWSLVEPSFRAAAVLDPGLAMPLRLELPSLRPPAAAQGERFVGVCPITDEKRKDISQASLGPLLDHIARTHPGMPIKVLVRDGAESLFDLGGRSGCELVNFRDLTRLRALFGTMTAYYGADTGLYHLAAAMGIPATVVFGPTQPGRIILPRQDAASVRLEVLAESHCDVKSCRSPACIEQACSNLASKDILVSLDSTPPDCPLRRHLPEARRINRWHRYPMTVEAAPVPQAR